MKEYHKIQTLYKRDPETKFKSLLAGEYALPEFEYLANNQWVMTEKVDGTNIRILCNPPATEGGEYAVTFRGKTDNAQIPAFLLEKLIDLFHGETMDTIQRIFPGGACLYGEGYGPKIQKGGGNYRQDQSFVLFDVKIGDWWLRREDVESIASQLELDVVPIIRIGPIKDAVMLCENGFKSEWGDFQAEGVVARPEVELQTRNGERIITKLKCRDFQ